MMYCSEQEPNVEGSFTKKQALKHKKDLLGSEKDGLGRPAKHQQQPEDVQSTQPTQRRRVAAVYIPEEGVTQSAAANMGKQSGTQKWKGK
ncbi:hypothetical protein Moror_3657 [Moniliophthora roreri MCA 2997]|nr:hypothetical protein Moror_3657 [Moniliophthora roreri MCA 2997]